jgi:uncharacterized protein
LRLNVGFLLHENVGFSRVFDFEHSGLRVGEDLETGSLAGSLRFTRTGQGLYGNGTLRATVPLECVRCLRTYDQPLRAELDELFVYPASPATEPALRIPETGILDLNPILREYFILAIPIRPVCRPDCRGLCPECGVNRNETNCGHGRNEASPRQSVLASQLVAH